MGPDAEDILCTTRISLVERDKYDSVIHVEWFDKHFGVRKNVVYEWARFNTHQQQHRERGEQYILVLYKVAENCDYSTAQKELEIRDHLIIGIRDTKLSQKLQMDPELTHENAKKKIQQEEAVKEQNQGLSSTSKAGDHRDTSIEIGYVMRKHCSALGRQQLSQHGRWNQVHSSREVASCTWCIREWHSRAECPARDAACHKCGKREHFSTQCFSKRKNLSELK